MDTGWGERQWTQPGRGPGEDAGGTARGAGAQRGRRGHEGRRRRARRGELGPDWVMGARWTRPPAWLGTAASHVTPRPAPSSAGWGAAAGQLRRPPPPLSAGGVAARGNPLLQGKGSFQSPEGSWHFWPGEWGANAAAAVASEAEAVGGEELARGRRTSPRCRSPSSPPFPSIRASLSSLLPSLCQEQDDTGWLWKTARSFCDIAHELPKFPHFQK